MNKMLTVIRREYLSRLKTKGFFIGTILTPVLLISFRVVPELMMSINSDKSKQIAVIDQTGEILDSLIVNLDEKNETGQRVYNFIKQEARPGELASVKQALVTQIENGKLDGYIFIPASIDTTGKAEYRSKIVTNFRENGRIETAISRAVAGRRFRQSGLKAEQVRQLVERVNLRAVRLNAGQEQEDKGRTEFLVWILVMFIYMAMIVYGQIVMRSVIEEKSSRVIEAVISSIKPFDLMAGKILGIGALGLTQYSIWALAFGVISRFDIQIPGLLNRTTALAVLPALPIAHLVFFIVFFVLGYLLFATMYAAVGAMVNSEQEAQQFVFPVVMLVVIPLMFTFYIIGNPNSQMALILSLIPFFAPLTMFARIVVLTPPAWQIAASLILLMGTIIGMIWLVGRIYRVGVLMYGKRPTLPEVIKWIRYA